MLNKAISVLSPQQAGRDGQTKPGPQVGRARLSSGLNPIILTRGPSSISVQIGRSSLALDNNRTAPARLFLEQILQRVVGRCVRLQYPYAPLAVLHHNLSTGSRQICLLEISPPRGFSGLVVIR